MHESDLQRLLDATSDAAFFAGTDGRIRFWNAAAEELLDRPAHQVLGKPCAEILAGMGDDGKPVCSITCPLLAPDAPCPAAFDLCVKNSHGDPHWINVSTLHAESLRGEPLTVHLARDIDARRRLEHVTRSFLAQIAGLTGDTVEHLMHPAPPPHEPLSEREKEVAHQLSLGHSTATIAAELGISPLTVRNHVRAILTKLSAHSRTEAVLRAVREKLI